MRAVPVLIGVVSTLLLTGCGGDEENGAPVAQAGDDQTVVVGSTVALDGSRSNDIDGDALSFTWRLDQAPTDSTAVFSDAAAERPTFVADRAGRYVLALVVSDGKLSSPEDTVAVVAAEAGNAIPLATPGPNQDVATGNAVTLDGSASSDADGDTLTYAWSLTSIPEGSTATLSDPTVANPTFTADLDGTYVARLVVNDGEADSTPGTVTISATTANHAPVAEAGPDQSIVSGSLVTLDGSASSDADDDTLTYAWSLTSIPEGSAATLSDPTLANPTFTADLDGTYVAQLTVNDATIDSTPDTLDVTATPLWRPVELVLSVDAVSGIDNYLDYAVPVRFDSDTIHLYFAGIAHKLYATVPSAIFRITSTDGGANWSEPERMAQLEGNYQSYPSAYVDGKLLLVWHDGNHSELHTTALTTAADAPGSPTRYVAYASAGREIIWTSHWASTLVGMWHSTGTANYAPFTGTAGATTATVSGTAWPFGGAFHFATPINASTAIVVTSSGLFRTAFDGTAFATPNAPLEFPTANTNLGYAGTTLHHAALDGASGYIYFTGHNQDSSKAAIYRTKLHH